MGAQKKLDIMLTANEAFIRDFRTALEIPPHILKDLAVYINTDNGILIKDDDRESILTLWKDANLPVDSLSNSYSVLKHIFDEGVKNDLSVEQILEELHEFSQQKGLTGFVERQEALKAILEPNPGYLKRRKVVPYAVGVASNLDAMAGIVQLRAAFADKDSTELVGYIPVAQIRLTLSNEAEGTQNQVVVFQVTEEALQKLIDNLKKYKSQLDAIKIESQQIKVLNVDSKKELT